MKQGIPAAASSAMHFGSGSVYDQYITGFGHADTTCTRCSYSCSTADARVSDAATMIASIAGERAAISIADA